MPRKKTDVVVPTTKAELAEAFADYPALDILERRTLDPHDPGSLPILLADEPDRCCGDLGHAMKAGFGMKAPSRAWKCRACGIPFRKWYVRWINVAEQERWSTIRARGFVKVHVKELKNVDDVAGLAGAAGDDVVSRGEKHGELLAKMPFPAFIDIKRTKEAAYNKARTRKGLKQELAEEAGRHIGDEAGQTLHDSLTVEEHTVHKTTLAEEMGLTR